MVKAEKGDDVVNQVEAAREQGQYLAHQTHPRKLRRRGPSRASREGKPPNIRIFLSFTIIKEYFTQ